jgi:hypothetical protein
MVTIMHEPTMKIAENSGLGRQDGWRGWLGSNQRPLASEANTLSTELQPRGREGKADPKDTVFIPASPRNPRQAAPFFVPNTHLYVYNRGLAPAATARHIVLRKL